MAAAIPFIIGAAKIGTAAYSVYSAVKGSGEGSDSSSNGDAPAPGAPEVEKKKLAARAQLAAGPATKGFGGNSNTARSFLLSL